MKSWSRPFPLHEVIEAARAAALDSYAILDTPATAQFDSLAAAMALDMDAPVALISFVDRERQWIKAAYGMAGGEVPRNVSFCHRTISEPAGTLVVRDALLSGHFARHPWVSGGPRLRSYAGAAMTDGDGYRLGAVCIMSPRQVRTEEIDLDGLRRWAAEVVAAVALHRAGVTAPWAPVLDPARRAGASGFSTVAGLASGATTGAARVRDTLTGRWAVPEVEAVTEAGPSTVQGWLGVRSESKRVRGGAEAGLLILSVASASPAERAGVVPGDVLLSVDGRPTVASEDILTALAGRVPGALLPLRLFRDGETVSVVMAVEASAAPRLLKRRRGDPGVKR